jgi:acetyltransferase-like isoleucine patch superfamily enzyme
MGFVFSITGRFGKRTLEKTSASRLPQSSTRPTREGVHIGDNTTLSFGSAVLTYDFINLRYVDTYVGKNCFIGAKSVIVAGVRVGDNCVIAVGAVVFRDVPAHSLVIGNPGRILETGIQTREYGIRTKEEYQEA